ncbi:MAG: ABC transporter permease [Rhodobacterales bacterium]
MPKRRFAFSRAIMALVLREMSSTYGRSPGGYIWAILEPIAGIAIFALAFGVMGFRPPLGESFGLFFATGFLPLALYMNLTVKVGGAIRYSRALLAYPKVTYIDAIIGRVVLTFLTQLVVFIIIVTGIIWGGDLNLIIDYTRIARAFAMALALGVGVGMVNCFLMSMFPIWQFIWAVLNRPMFIASGVLFLIDGISEDIRNMIMLNPMAHVVSMMRSGLFSSYDAPYVSEVYVYMVAGVLALLGMILLHRYHRVILDEG